MVLLFIALFLASSGAWAQQPALSLVAGRDSVGVGDTLEVWVEVDAQNRALSSASAYISLEAGIYRTVQQAACDHREEIRRRFPRILRRVSGYNLDVIAEGFDSGKPVGLQQIIVGSEGKIGRAHV